VERLLCNKIVYSLIAVAIFLVGMLRDPDLANGDDLDTGPIASDHLPGYQVMPDGAPSHPLSAAERAQLNTPPDSVVPTF